MLWLRAGVFKKGTVNKAGSKNGLFYGQVCQRLTRLDADDYPSVDFEDKLNHSRVATMLFDLVWSIYFLKPRVSSISTFFLLITVRRILIIQLSIYPSKYRTTSTQLTQPFKYNLLPSNLHCIQKQWNQVESFLTLSAIPSALLTCEMCHN